MQCFYMGLLNIYGLTAPERRCEEAGDIPTTLTRTLQITRATRIQRIGNLAECAYPYEYVLAEKTNREFLYGTIILRANYCSPGELSPIDIR